MRYLYNLIQTLGRKVFNGFKILLQKIKQGFLFSSRRLKRGCCFLVHLPILLWQSLKDDHNKISFRWCLLSSLILIISLTIQWEYLSSRQSLPESNSLFFRINDMQVEFKKNIELKKMPKGQYEAWFQKGEIFHSEQSVDRNLPYCEIDFKKTTKEPFIQSRIIKSGKMSPLDTLGIIKESTWMNLLLFSNDFKSDTKENFEFHYVDCYIPDKHFEKDMKIDIDYVNRITKGAVVIKKLKEKLATFKKSKKTSREKNRNISSH